MLRWNNVAQRSYNVSARCWNNIVVQSWKSDVWFCFIFNARSILFQRWSTTLKQRWSGVEMLAGYTRDIFRTHSNIYNVFFLVIFAKKLNRPCLTGFYPPGNKTSWQRRNDVPLHVPATLQVRLKSNTHRRLDGKSPRRLVVRLHDNLLERRDNFSRGHNNDVPSVRLHDVSSKSQMKWYVTKTSQWYVFTTSH